MYRYRSFIQDVRFRNLLVSDLKRLLLLYRKNSARSYFFTLYNICLERSYFHILHGKYVTDAPYCVRSRENNFFPKPFCEKTALFNLHVFPPIQNSFSGRTSEPDDSWWNIFASGQQHQDQQLSKGKQVLLVFSELLAFLHLNLPSSSRDSPFLICPPSGTARPQSLYSRQPTPQGPNPPNS